MAENNLPTLRPEGVSEAGETSETSLRPLDVLRVSQAVSLSDLLGEYVFYTDALVHCRVPLSGRQPLSDFLQQHPQCPPPASLVVDRPLFSGLEIDNDHRWNHVLMAFSRPFWSEFFAFMGSLSFLAYDTRSLTRVRTQPLQVVDPLRLAKLSHVSQLPTIEATAFVLDSNRGCWFFDPQPVSFLQPVVHAVRSDFVFEDTCLFAKEMFESDSPDPYKSIRESLHP